MKKEFFAFLFAIPVMAIAQNVEWISTTNDCPWVKEKKIVLNDKPAKENILIEVFSNQPLQRIEGFGGCFNELGWNALNLLPAKEQGKIFEALFTPEGANFYYNRFPVGASDYASGFYSLNEIKNDFEMNHFSIERDKKCLIPYIKRAQQYNPNMRFFASPWCPPSWMKTNEHYASLSSDKYNDLPKSLESVTGTTGFKMLKGYLNSYALYFSKFLDAYKKEGINVSDIHVQNEVIAEQVFPSCIWQPQDIALFIADYLGPRFEKENRNVNIWLGTLNVGDFNYVKTAMNNSKAAKYIKGLGFQWDGKNAIAQAHKDFPQLKLMQTENECGNGENNWKSAEHTWSLIKHYIGNGAESYIYWNFILQTPGVSYWGWVQNSMVTINANTKDVVYTPEFYLMKHLSHYVQSGASLLKIIGSKDALAFKNIDGSVIIVFANMNGTAQSVSLKVNGKYINVKAKANSFNTFKL
jgi:glucosylceramidase